LTYESLHECSAKIYKTGLVVLYKKHKGRSRQEMIEAARQPRHYQIKKSEVVSAAINLYNRKKYQVYFITFTFAFNPTELQASRIWTNYLKNLKLNYNVNNYVWVKEKQKSGRLHFHALIDSPRNNIAKLQSSFNNTVKNFDNTLAISNNSVRLGNNPVVFNIQQCAKYISKYISKSRDDIYQQRAYGFTVEISDVCREIDTYQLDELALKYEVKHVYTAAFFEIFILKGYQESKNIESPIVKFANSS